MGLSGTKLTRPGMDSDGALLPARADTQTRAWLAGLDPSNAELAIQLPWALRPCSPPRSRGAPKILPPVGQEDRNCSPPFVGLGEEPAAFPGFVHLAAPSQPL